MTEEERQRRLEELYAEADAAGCAVAPAVPIPPPAAEGAGGRPHPRGEA